MDVSEMIYEPAFIVPNIVSFLSAHTSLRYLELSYLNTGPNLIELLQVVMERLLLLSELVLNITIDLPLPEQLSLLEMGRQLEKFHISLNPYFGTQHELETSELELYRQWVDARRGTDCRIKDLYLNTEVFKDTMADYLCLCSGLERFSMLIPTTAPSTLYLEIAQILRTGCRRLQHLDLQYMQNSETAQSTIINACCSTPADEIQKCGLQSLTAGLSGSTMDEVLIAVLRHQTTLTFLCVRRGKGLLAVGLQQIMTGCKNLRTARVQLRFTNNSPVAMGQIAGQVWGCSKLQSFSLLTVDCCTASGLKSALEYMQYLYTQIGSLQTLEVLSFRMEQVGLASMRQTGWIPMQGLIVKGLDHLYRLSQLRVFHVHKEEAIMFKKCHIKTMLNSWPRLEQLAGLREDFQTFPLADWLKGVRPDLDLGPQDKKIWKGHECS